MAIVEPSPHQTPATLSQANTKIVAVVVTYQPTLPLIQRLLDVLILQVNAIVVVDNASNVDVFASIRSSSSQNQFVVALDQNHGVGYAQNVGVQWAREQSATHVLLMDQDSVPHPDMVINLLSALQSSPTVAAVGPRYLDHRQANPRPFVRLRGLRLKRMPWDPGHQIVPVDCLIASGCLIPVSSLERVGPMREDLFIDYVDTEWCLRARRHGLQSYGVCNAAMTHCLGEEPFCLFGRAFPVHSPLRHYYQVRNAMILCRESWIPLNWKIAISWQSLLRFGFYTIVTAPRFEHFRMMVLGLWHAFLGRAGKLLP